ncbi:MAG: hypothetical protein ACLTDV_06370 [Eubacterium sp.]
MPKIVQLGKYLGNLFHGDFGTSIKMQKNRAVLDIIKDMFPVSAKIGVFALCRAIAAGLPWRDVWRLTKEGTWVDGFPPRVVCTIGISMPWIRSYGNQCCCIHYVGVFRE